MKDIHRCAILGAVAVLASTSIGLAADRHQTPMMHHDGPTEPGQSAFAAIAEIVALLDADPTTDWSQVDIPALREHLVDMSELTLKATAIERAIEGGTEFTITGEGRTRDAIQRMVPAHAAELAMIPGWSASAEMIDDGAKLVVTSIEPLDRARIQGSGFFGLMATGSHHQAHHMAIARGAPLHRHE